MSIQLKISQSAGDDFKQGVGRVGGGGDTKWCIFYRTPAKQVQADPGTSYAEKQRREIP